MSDESFEVGIQSKEFQGVRIQVYDPEKTVADCFKFRSRVGTDVAIEALKRWKEKRSKHLAKLISYAKICRVEKIMGPYLEALS